MTDGIHYNQVMAIESLYLRNKVKYRTARIKKMLELEEVPDDRVDQLYSAIEIYIIEIAALTRKLRDLGKLPDGTLENTSIRLKRFESLGADSQRVIADFEKEYNLKEAKDGRLPLARIVDLIIHSYILQTIGDEDRAFVHLLVTSDYSRFSGLYMITLSDFIKACNEVAGAYPSSLHAIYDQQAQKWIHTRT